RRAATASRPGGDDRHRQLVPGCGCLLRGVPLPGRLTGGHHRFSADRVDIDAPITKLGPSRGGALRQERVVGPHLPGVVVAMALSAALTTPRSGRAAGSSEALALCRQADQAADHEKRDLLERGLAAAEAAVSADDTDAHAHFAVFCNLGKRMRL